MHQQCWYLECLSHRRKRNFLFPDPQSHSGSLIMEWRLAPPASARNISVLYQYKIFSIRCMPFCSATPGHCPHNSTPGFQPGLYFLKSRHTCAAHVTPLAGAARKRPKEALTFYQLSNRSAKLSKTKHRSFFDTILIAATDFLFRSTDVVWTTAAGTRTFKRDVDSDVRCWHN